VNVFQKEMPVVSADYAMTLSTINEYHAGPTTNTVSQKFCV